MTNTNYNEAFSSILRNQKEIYSELSKMKDANGGYPAPDEFLTCLLYTSDAADE